MKTSKIDTIFKDKLYDYRSNPMPESWEKISGNLSRLEQLEKRKKRLVYYSIAASFAALVTIVISVFLAQEQPIPSSGEQAVQILPKDSAVQPIPTDQVKNETSLPAVTPLSPKPEFLTIEEKTSGTKKEFRLPDGSLLVLNKNSSLRYSKPFTERVVYLSGEAYFDIKSDKKHPFVVKGNCSNTEVTGTSFTVRSYPSEKYDEINVATGKVSFGKTIDKDDKIIILAGHKGVVRGETIEETVIDDLNYNSWLTDKIIFHNTKLKEVFKVLEKHYNVFLSAKNPKILNCQFTGEFEKSDINEILEVLSVSFSLSFDQESKHYTLSGKGCK